MEASQRGVSWQNHFLPSSPDSWLLISVSSWIRTVCHPPRALSRAGPRWRRSRRGRVHPPGLISPPTKCSPATVACRAEQLSSQLALLWERSARRCSTWRAISARRHLLGHQLAMVERFGATAIDYRAGDFVATVRGTHRRAQGRGRRRCSLRCDWRRAFRGLSLLAPGGLLVGYGAQAMAVGGASLVSAALGLSGSNSGTH